MLDSNIPCYSNTTFNYDNFIIEQVKDDSLDSIAEYCCSSSEYCNLASISTEMCCTGKHCTKQCYGVNWPLTDTTVTDLNNLNVVKNREMKPPKSLFNAVFNETS
uniref:Uncharacterized protein n=1 Tax=Panagrolaimus sp. PS1159 TaxID=55785 RepID=A0AC35FW84_9BILA